MQLYILVDDLRPELGAYGVTTPMTAGTPNMDRLAGDSLLFERAYAQQVNDSGKRTIEFTCPLTFCWHVYLYLH